ncbi:MAG TPA: hypothetical protein VM347_35620 [Nonomuraea sp.]|nr:hypothetical protein [Nonomuraea sp.]
MTEDLVATLAEQVGEVSTDTKQIETAPVYIVLDDMTERTKAFHFVAAPDAFPMTSVGDSVVYEDEIFNADKEVVGHTIGMARVVRKRESDDHIFAEYDEVVQLQDGIMRATGTFDRNALLAGACVRLKLEGLSGRYAGMSGFREWQVIPPLTDAFVRLRMVLAG